MLDTVKLALRLKTNVFDTELNLYINAFVNDMVRSGASSDIVTSTSTDPSVVSCCIAYVKWQMDFQGQGERWYNIYMQMKTALILDKDYQ